jgi:hypothetical protein
MKTRRKKGLGETFIAHRRSLLESCSWRALTLECRQLLTRIEIEHLRHGGKENGKLVVPYTDFLDYGVGHRSYIARAIRDAEALGLLRIVRGRAGNGRPVPNQYRLTYLPAADQDATDEWREIKTMDDAKSRIAAVKKPRKPSTWFRAGRAAKVVPLAS